MLIVSIAKKSQFYTIERMFAIETIRKSILTSSRFTTRSAYFTKKKVFDFSKIIVDK